jgi:hypothetical protein
MKNGEGKGRNFIEMYRRDILEMFQKGVSDVGNKQHPAWMREQLEQKYPEAVALPSEGEIRAEVTRLFRLQKLGKPLDIPPGKRGRQGLDTHFITVLEDLLSQSTTEAGRKPAVIYEQFIEYFTTHPPPTNLEIPEKKKIIAKISSLKQIMKQR